MTVAKSCDPLPVKTIDIKTYVREHEAAHPVRKEGSVPCDPSSRWFKKDAITECIESCRYELFKTAQSESQNRTEDVRRTVHARYASLQADCIDACKSHISKQ
jgi:hypothetical protein